MKLTQIGEFGLIKKIKEELSKFERKRVVVGIGDDAAAVEIDGEKLTLLTTDTLVENVHFQWDYASPFKVGWKSLAVNISDIAAMGGNPLYSLVSLSLPSETESFRIEDLYEGLKEIASQYRVNIVGGNIVHSPFFTITISLIGEVKRENILLRSGAREGDLIYTTGEIGSSRAGLDCLRKPDLKIDLKKREFLERKHLLPSPRLREGQILAKERVVTSAIDISDGLISDLRRITEESRVGAILWEERIPISAVSEEVAKRVGASSLEWALYGGEDYELLFTVPEDKREEIEKLGFSVYLIGKILEKEEGISLIKKRGKRISLQEKGYDHFRVHRN
ncbi:thiamine-phosphate kinase [Candidatus Aerophobetes bacterium]|nr:thiamine-phosphate kinase [Candidatus Aerophobetes bacterium]